MGRSKLIITESEREEIRKSYNLNEQNSQSDNFLTDFLTGEKNIFKTLLSKLSGKDDESSEEGESETSSSYDGEVKISEKGQELLNNPVFKEKLSEISKEINIDENSIIKIMNLESGLNPNVKNSIGCVGLIQFCPDTARGNYKTISGKRYNLEELRNNLPLQMDAILEFWKTGYKTGKIKEPKDLYLYNFFPIAAGKPDNFVLQTNNLSAEKIAKQNPIFNRTLGKPVGTPLTVGDMENYYKKVGMA
jgi:hypothetical protein